MSTILFLRSNFNYYKPNKAKKPSLYPTVTVFHTQKYNKTLVINYITWFIHLELNHFYS